MPTYLTDPSKCPADTTPVGGFNPRPPCFRCMLAMPQRSRSLDRCPIALARAHLRKAGLDRLDAFDADLRHKIEDANRPAPSKRVID